MGRIWTCDEGYNGNAISFSRYSDSDCTILVNTTDQLTADGEAQPWIEQYSEDGPFSSETSSTYVCRRFVECSDTAIITPTVSPTIAPTSPTNHPTIAPSASPTQPTSPTGISVNDNNNNENDDNNDNGKMYGSIAIIMFIVASAILFA